MRGAEEAESPPFPQMSTGNKDSEKSKIHPSTYLAASGRALSQAPRILGAGERPEENRPEPING